MKSAPTAILLLLALAGLACNPLAGERATVTPLPSVSEVSQREMQRLLADAGPNERMAIPDTDVTALFAPCDDREAATWHVWAAFVHHPADVPLSSLVMFRPEVRPHITNFATEEGRRQLETVTGNQALMEEVWNASFPRAERCGSGGVSH